MSKTSPPSQFLPLRCDVWGQPPTDYWGGWPQTSQAGRGARVAALVAVGRLVARADLRREESRGSHARADFRCEMT
ncbi:MAG: hypothetical protein FJW22_04960 [Acidimicrobiia bacterium]|nr:hypothetical protein [Acidimicrobiia bacterium]